MSDTGRKHPVHQPLRESHNAPVIIFLTVCTKEKKKILANPQVHLVLQQTWNAADSWIVGRYVIMPDHVHLFCAPKKYPAEALLRWVNLWKSFAANHWPRPEDSPIWQRHFWDTQLRRFQSYDEKWNYVVQNPVRAGLTKHADEWPYQGKLNDLRW